MKKINYLLFLFLCASTLAVQAQQFSGNLKEIRPDQVKDLNNQFSKYEVYQIDRAAMNAYVKSQTGPFPLELALGEHQWSFQLEATSVFSKEASIKVMEAGRNRLLKDPIVNNYVGHQGELENKSKLFISKNLFWGIITTDHHKKRIYPLKDFFAAAADDLYILADYFSAPESENPRELTGASLCADDNLNCSTIQVFQGDSLSDLRYIEMIAVGDYAFYNIFKGDNCTDQQCVDNAIGKIESIVAAASFVYQSYFDVSIVINHLEMWAVSDPYPITIPGIWHKMGAIWGFANTECINRDVVHLFSGKNMPQGGWTSDEGFGAICSDPRNAYSYTDCHAGNSSFFYKTTAHEIGHGLGAGHLNDCNTECGDYQNSPMMCEFGAGTNSDPITVDAQCTMLIQFLGRECFLENRPFEEENCPQCAVQVEIEVDKDVALASCTAYDEIEVTVRVTNNCEDRTFNYVRFKYDSPYLEPAHSDLGDFDNLFDIGFGERLLEVEDFFLASNEIRTFKIKMNVVESDPSGYIFLSTQLSFDIESGIMTRTDITSLPTPNTDVEIDGTTSPAKISELIANQTIPPSPQFCEDDSFIWKIEGTLEIDQNYRTTEGSKLIMGPGAEIIVKPGATFVICKTDIFACSEMWKGITVEQGGDLKAFQSTFKNAEFAITANTNAIIDINSNRFINNYVGFHVPPSSDGNARDVLIGDFYANLYSGTADLLPPYPNQANHSTKAYSGILVHDLNSLNLEAFQTSLGTPINNFRDMQNGIRAYNTNVSLEKCVFENINITNESCAVYMEGDGDDWLFQANDFPDDTPNTDTDFLNCRTGIKSINMNLNVFGNFMEKVQTGISVELSPNREINITDNQIRECSWGISLYQCAPVMGLVYNNDIKVDGSFLAAGIIINENPSVPSGWNISKNLLLLSESTFGIFHRSGKRSQITNNTLLFDQPMMNGYVGIHLEDSPETSVRCNMIDGFGIDSKLNYRGAAISVHNSTGTNISCNNVSNSNIGIQYWGYCGKNQFKGNILGRHQLGLLLGAYYNNNPVNGIVTFSKQDHTGNRWTNLFNGNNIPSGYYGAINLADAGQTPYPGSLLVDGIEDPQFFPNYFANQQNWVQHIPTVATSFDCNDRPTCPKGIGWYEFAEASDERQEARNQTALQSFNSDQISTIFKNTISNGHKNFSNEELIALRTMAQQCPFIGGNAVYEARSLLSSVESLDYNDFKICQEKTDLTKNNSNTEVQLKLMPNPASSILNVFLEFNHDQESHLQLYDTFGRLVKNIAISSKQKTLEIDVSNLPSGIYHLSWELNNDILFTQKIVVTH